MIYHSHRSKPSVWEEGTPYATFDDLQLAVNDAVATVSRHGEEFDVIVVQGASGMSIGFPLALELQRQGWGVKIVVARKSGENSHSGLEKITGGNVKEQRCLFVDDFVSGGSTRARVRNAVEACGGVLVAQYMSREDEYQVL